MLVGWQQQQWQAVFVGFTVFFTSFFFLFREECSPPAAHTLLSPSSSLHFAFPSCVLSASAHH
jgi:hypothetical protein